MHVVFVEGNDFFVCGQRAMCVTVAFGMQLISKSELLLRFGRYCSQTSWDNAHFCISIRELALDRAFVRLKRSTRPISCVLAPYLVLCAFELVLVAKSKIKSTQMHREMETFQEAIIRHCIIAEVVLYAFAIEQRADFLLHCCRRWVDDHEVELVKRRH